MFQSFAELLEKIRPTMSILDKVDGRLSPEQNNAQWSAIIRQTLHNWIEDPTLISKDTKSPSPDFVCHLYGFANYCRTQQVAAPMSITTECDGQIVMIWTCENKQTSGIWHAAAYFDENNVEFVGLFNGDMKHQRLKYPRWRT